MHDPTTQFVTALAARAPDLGCRLRSSGDRDFLIDCAIACSPMAGLLPPAMLAQQALLHRTAHDEGWPDAMHPIVTRDGTPIGHARIAWGAGETHLIDLAVLPAQRGRGVAGHILTAWLAVSDSFGWAAVLQVQADNPARHLYARHGFTAVDPDPYAAFVTMRRAPTV